MWELISDLRDMGESNAILGRRAWVSRDVLMAAESIYRGESFDDAYDISAEISKLLRSIANLRLDMYGKEEGSVPATFQIIYFVRLHCYRIKLIK